jgi:hypothetical protein
MHVCFVNIVEHFTAERQGKLDSVYAEQRAIVPEKRCMYHIISTKVEVPFPDI